MKGLPMTYNRDMQEDKEPVFDSIDTVKAALAIFAEMIDGASFRESRGAEAAADPNLLATDLADRLVLGGVPFRSAHEIVGKLVSLAAAKQLPLDQLNELDYAAASPVLTPAVIASTFDVASGLAARQAPGAPSAQNVSARIAHWKSVLQ